MKFKNIFITGGAGYVGSALVPKLLEKGHKITVYDLCFYGNTLDLHPNLAIIKGDIRDKEKLIKAAENHDVFIHLACISNDPSFDLAPDLGKSINFDAFRNIIEACQKNNAQRLIVASSSSQYGIKPLNMKVTEETEAEPITDYAKYKIQCEILLQNTPVNFEYVFVRPATLCGYSRRLRLDLSVNLLTINALIRKKITVFGGLQMRPALNLKDMVRFYELMLEVPGSLINRQAFNIAARNITIKDIAIMVKEVIGDPTIEFQVTPSDDQRSYHINCDKAKRVLGFECKYDIPEAIKTLIEAYNKGLIHDGLNNSYYHNVKRMKEMGLQ